MATGTASVLSAPIPSSELWRICLAFASENSQWQVVSADPIYHSLTLTRSATVGERVARAVKWGGLGIFGIFFGATDPGRELRLHVRSSSGTLVDSASEVTVFSGREASVVDPQGRDRQLMEECIQWLATQIEARTNLRPMPGGDQWRPPV